MAQFLDRQMLDRLIERPVTVAPDLLVSDAIALLDRSQSNFLLVIENERILGIFTPKELIRLVAAQNDLATLKIARVMGAAIAAKLNDLQDPIAVLSRLEQQQSECLVVLDEEDKLMGVIKTKRLAESLQQQKSIEILESMSDAFFVLDRQWRFTYLNQQAERSLQRSRENLLRRCFWDEFPEMVGSRCDREFRNALAQQTKVTFEEYFLPLDSWFEVRICPSEDSLSVYFKDISDRTETEAELLRQIERSRVFSEISLKIRQSLQPEEILQTAVTEVQKLLKADRVLIFRLWEDGSGTVVREAVLNGFPAILGQQIHDPCFSRDYVQQYVNGKISTISDIYNADIESCHVDLLSRFNVRANLVVPILQRNSCWGLSIAHQCSSPRQWSDFEVELLQQIANQIGIALAQAHMLEREVRQCEELARSNTELQQFAYVASHDLQEPLRMVASYLQLLERRYKNRLDAKADEFIAYAVDGANRMKVLIEALLSYSRVSTRGQPFELVDCNEIVASAIANLKVAIAETKANVRYESLPQIMADAAQLTQLFQNLIANAIKFCNDRSPQIQIGARLYGSASIADKKREKGDLALAENAPSMNQPAIEWLFWVSDNGIGIEKEYRDRIFAIFQRLHGRGKYPGTGIGLSICKRIVERHGGRIWVESELGAGSTFYFTVREEAN
jgi:light-regulated signal transduction histidine kinase (bacteriophytochrome)/CBS domain-containing protein